MESLLRDLRYSVRQLRRNPGFTLVAVLSLALGMGANTTIFSAAASLLDRTLDVPRAEELARVYSNRHSPLNANVFLSFARNTRVFSDLLAEDPLSVGLARGELNVPADAAMVSTNFFSGLGVGPAAGQVFAGKAGDDPGPVAVLTYRYWQARFGGDREIIGQSVRINGHPFTVIGVAREGFTSSQFGWRPDLFVPLAQYPALLGIPSGTYGGSMYVTGRLAQGRTYADADIELAGMAAMLPEPPTPRPAFPAFHAAHARGITEEARTPITLGSAFLLVIVGFVLLIACANVANLLLARATARRKEIAIRLALGVGRGRLVRQLLVESTVVALLGGAVALVIAFWTTRLLPSLVPPDVPVAIDFSPDAKVALFAALLSLVTGLLFGLAPALQATKADVQGALKSGPATRGAGRSRLRSAFLVTQVALAMVLLVGAALFLRSLAKARVIDPGFRTAGVVDLPINLALRQYDRERGAGFYQTLLDKTRRLPGVQAAALTDQVPLSGSNQASPVGRSEADPDDPGSYQQAYFTTVSRGYFEMMGIPLVRGRVFDMEDRAGGAGAVILNETLARNLFQGEDALGRTMRFRGDSAVLTVIGIAKDVKYHTLGERDTPFLYMPFEQRYEAATILQVRFDPPADAAAYDRLRQSTQELDPALPLQTVRSFQDDMRISLVFAQAGAGLLGTFGLLALFLASIGVYGVTAYLVAQRTGEIGLRSALGARPVHVLRLVLSDATRTVGLGLLIGLVGGAGLGKVISNQLYGVSSLDPITFAGAPLVLALVALIASLIPARRALKVDPVIALRAD